MNSNKFKIGWEYKKLNLYLSTLKVEDSPDQLILRVFQSGDFPKAKYV
jgi:hypothetical protein